MIGDDEEALLRTVALQNATSITTARQRAEQELIRVKEALEERTAALTASLAAVEATLAERDTARAVAEAAREVALNASAAKSRFLSMISHELRTPLGAIGGYAALLEEEIHGPLTDVQRVYLGRIRHNTAHVLELVNELLDLARIESGQFTLRLEVVSLRQVLESVHSMIEPQITAGGLRVTLASVGPAVTARADRERLEQILLNLLSNAVKFTPAGGTIEVAVGHGADVIRIDVRDTGIGIPADKTEAVFQPFVQVDLTRVHATAGTGLGLAISRELARVMGGDLTVVSVLGQGSVFTLSLPRGE